MKMIFPIFSTSIYMLLYEVLPIESFFNMQLLNVLWVTRLTLLNILSHLLPLHNLTVNLTLREINASTYE